MTLVIDTSNNNPAELVDAIVSRASALIAKATEWSTGGLYRDPTYYGQRAIARRAGVPFGAFLFLHANVDGAAQARAFLTYAELRPGDLQPIIDAETTDGDSWSRVASTLLECAGELERHGYRPLVYASSSFWQSLRDVAPAITRYPVWEAQYPGVFWRLVPGLLRLRAKLRRGATVKLWQFTASYRVGGRHFDASLALASLASIRIPATR